MTYGEWRKKNKEGTSTQSVTATAATPQVEGLEESQATGYSAWRKAKGTPQQDKTGYGAWRAAKRKTETAVTAPVSLESWINSADALLSSFGSQDGWQDKSYFSGNSQKLDELTRNAYKLKEQYKGNREAVSYLEDMIGYLGQLGAANYNQGKHYGQWASKQDFDTYMADPESPENLLSFDLKKGQAEIDALKADKESFFSDYNKGVLSDRSVELMKSYGYDVNSLVYGMEKEISDKQSYFTRAQRYQDAYALSDAAVKDTEFENLSAYVSTEMAYDDWLKEYQAVLSAEGYSEAELKELEDASILQQNGNGTMYRDTIYEFINGKDNGVREALLNRARESRGSYDTDTVYEAMALDQMTDEEIAIYNYYYAKGGKEAAEKYLDSIQETLNYRKGKGKYEQLQGNTLKQVLYSISSGWDQFKRGVAGLLNSEGEYIPASYTQYAAAMTREDLGWLGRVAFDALQSGANMAPSLLLSTAVGVINPTLGAVVGSGLLGATAGGNAYQDAINQGYDKESASNYGKLIGASEGALQFVLGGIGKLGGALTGKSLSSMMNGINSGFLRCSAKLGASILSEATEEGLQEILTPIFKNAVLHTDEQVNWSDVAYSALLGGLTGGLFEAVPTVSNSKSEKAVYEMEKQLDGMSTEQKLSELKLYVNDKDISVREQAIEYYQKLEAGEDVKSEELAKVILTGSQEIFRRLVAEVENAEASEETIPQSPSGDGDSSLYTREPSVQITNRNAQTVDKVFEGEFGSEGKKLLSQVYDQVEGEGRDSSDTDLARGFKMYYDAGLSNQSVDSVKYQGKALNDFQKAAIWNAGQQDSSRSRQQAREGTYVTYRGNGAGLVKSEYADALADTSPAVFNAANRYAEKVGVKLRVEKLGVDENGLQQQGYIENGTVVINGELLTNPSSVSSADTFTQGGRLWSKGEAYDKVAEAFLGVLSHEVTHRLQKTASVEYYAFRDYVMGVYQRSGELQSRIELYREAYGDKAATREKAMDEMAADYIKRMVKDTSLYADFVKQSKKNLSIGKKLLQWFKDILAKIRQTVKGREARNAAMVEATGYSLSEVENAVKLWEKALKAAEAEVNKGTRAVQGNENTASNKEAASLGKRNALDVDGAAYDYSKPFSEQVDDWIAGRIPQRDSLVVSETPAIWKMIGLNALPVTINQKHIDYAINGTKDFDHQLTKQGLLQLPEAIKHPVAIISSKTKNGTSLVAMLDIRQNGKQVIVPVVIDGFAQQNNLLIDSNAITSAYGKNYSISNVLYNALNNEANGKAFSVYYVDIGKATALLQKARVPMPKGSAIGANGFVHSIDEPGSPVNKKLANQTQTQQFKRWFGKSKIVDISGKPMVMYHGTKAENGDFTVFDSSKAVKKGGLGFKALGKGNYFTSKKLDGTERYGSRVIPAYLSIQNPFVKEIGTLSLQEQFEEATGIYTEGYDALQDAMRKAGYDGVVQYDNDRNINIAVAFDSNQIKSAADNIGTFDGRNPDIRYSLDLSTLEARKKVEDAAKARLAYLRKRVAATTSATADPRSVETVAAKLISRYEADMDRTELAQELQVLYDKILRKGDNDAQLYDRAVEIAEKIAGESVDVGIAIEATQAETAQLDSATAAIAADILEQSQSIRQFKSLKQVQDDARLAGRMAQGRMDAEKIRKAREQLQRVRQSRDEQVRALREKNAEKLEKMRESAAVKKYRQRVEKNVKKLSDMLLKNTDKQHIPEALKDVVGRFLTSIDFSSATVLKHNNRALAGIGEAIPTKRDLSYTEMLSDVERLLAKQNGNEENAGYLDLPPEFTEKIEEHIKQVRNTALGLDVGTNQVYAMNAEQLKDLNFILTVLNHSIGQINQLTENGRFESAREAARTSISSMNAMGGKMKPKNPNDKLYGWAFWNSATPFYAFKRFGEGGQAIFEGLQRGWDTLGFHSDQLINFAEETYTEKEVKDWGKETHAVKLESGKTVKLTAAQVMSLYCLAKREQAVGHLLGGGIRVADFGKGNKTVSQTEDYPLTQRDIETIAGLLTDRQIAVADALQNYMNTVGTEWGNEVSMKRFGYRAFTESNYFPITSDPVNLKNFSSEAEANEMFRLLNLGMTKSLTKGANNAVTLSDIFDVFADHMSDMAKYNALAMPILDAVKWYNYQDVQRIGERQIQTQTVKKAMDSAWGSRASNYFTTFMKDLNGKQEGGRGDGFARRAISNYKVAAVGANLRVALLQPTSYVRAATVIDPKYLSKGIFIKGGQEEMLAHSGIAKWKNLGFYDTNIGRGIRDQIKNEATFKEKLVEGSMWAAEKGDKLTWGALWNACKLEVMDKQKLTGDALLEATAQRFRDVVYQTQVVDSTMTRSHAMRDKNVFMNMATAFMSEPTLGYNMMMDAAMSYRMADKPGKVQAAKQFARTAVSFTMTTALAAVAASLMDAWRDDDEYKSFFEKFAEAFGDNLASDMNLLNKLPFAKDVLSLIDGYSVDRMDVVGIKNLLDAVNIWTETYDVLVNGGEWTDTTYNGRMTLYGKIYKTLQAISQVIGLPVSSMAREGVSLFNNTIGRWYDMDPIRTYDPGAKNSVRYAYADGYLTDEEAIRALIEDASLSEEDAKKLVRDWKEDMSGVFDSLKDAIAGGNSTEEAISELRIIGYSDENISTRVKSIVRQLREEGKLTEERAIHALMESAGMTRTKAESQIASWNQSDLREAFLAGGLSEKDAVAALVEQTGVSEEKATEILRGWKTDAGGLNAGLKDALSSGKGIDQAVKELKTAGWGDKDIESKVKEDVRELFFEGAITEVQAKDYYKKYAGMDGDEAVERVQYMSFQRDNPDSKLAQKPALMWQKTLKGMGISLGEWERVYTDCSAFDSKNDAGKTVTGLRERRVRQYLSKLTGENAGNLRMAILTVLNFN